MKLYKRDIKTVSEGEYEYMRFFIPPEKLAKIDRYKNYADRLRSVCGYSLALSAIAELEKIPLGEAVILYDENGKPYSGNSPLRFSISHSEDMVICACSLKNIGADIEKIRKTSLLAAKRVCSKAELEYIFGKEPESEDFETENPETLKRFFEIWTRKEAFGKKEGFGIGYDMKSHDVLGENSIYLGEYVISVCEDT